MYIYPFVYPIDDDLNIHIEHIDDSISCIWFDNNNQEEQNIPKEFKIYNKKYEILKPFRNTQSYAITRDFEAYTIKYNKTIIKLTTEFLPSNPPTRINEINVVSSE